MRRWVDAPVVLLLCVAIASCSGSSGNLPSCESICASAMACPHFDLNNTFGVPPGSSSCADACALAHAMIDAAHCNAEYDAVAKCASMHNQCTEDLQVACGNAGGTFLACLQNGVRGDGGTVPDPDAGAQACNVIEDVGQTVSKTATTAPNPDTVSFTGGAIADGTYVLTAMLYYAASAAPPGTRKETLVFNGGTLKAVYSIDGAAEERYTATFATPAGSFGEIEIHLSCFVSAPSASLNSNTAYTATATELRVVADANEVSTYSKR
jgi:hypothetical protein